MKASQAAEPKLHAAGGPKLHAGPKRSASGDDEDTEGHSMRGQPGLAQAPRRRWSEAPRRPEALRQ